MKSFQHYINTLQNLTMIYINQRRGWTTDRKIIVIESDDWGSIRMPSKEVYDILLKDGYRVDLRLYERFDSLESDEDISALFEILSKYYDINGNHPIITANTLVANPDFQRIAENAYNEYFFESILETYKKYEGRTNAHNLIMNGIDLGLFKPQSHGREHFNIYCWMNALRNGDKDILRAFELDICGIFPKNNPSYGNKFMIAFESKNDTSQQYVLETIKDGLKMFETIFGYKSKTFIAPCYTWNDNIERLLYNHGVELIQSAVKQRLSDDINKIKYHYIGQKNKYNQRYLIRNCSFEPSLFKNKSNVVNNTLMQIRTAFNNHKPAIICSHRVNYIGSISVNNREENLVLLDELITRIKCTWNNVEFMSSDMLIELIK